MLAYSSESDPSRRKLKEGVDSEEQHRAKGEIKGSRNSVREVFANLYRLFRNVKRCLLPLFAGGDTEITVRKSLSSKPSRCEKAPLR